MRRLELVISVSNQNSVCVCVCVREREREREEREHFKMLLFGRIRFVVTQTLISAKLVHFLSAMKTWNILELSWILET